MQHLDRDLPREHGVVCAEDLTHPARGDTIDDVVAAVQRDEVEGVGTTGRSLGERALGRGGTSRRGLI